MNDYKVGDKIQFVGAFEGALIIADLKSAGIKAKAENFDQKTGKGKVVIVEVPSEVEKKALPEVKHIEASRLNEALRLANEAKRLYDSARDRFCFELMTSRDEYVGKQFRNAMEEFIKYMEELKA